MTAKGEAASRKIIRDAKRSSSSGCIRNPNPGGGAPFGGLRAGRTPKKPKGRRVAKGATLRYTGERQIPAAAGGLTRATAKSRFLVVPAKAPGLARNDNQGKAASRKIIRDAKRSSSFECVCNRNPRGGPPFGRLRAGRTPNKPKGRDSALQKRTADSSSVRQNSAGTRSE